MKTLSKLASAAFALSLVASAAVAFSASPTAAATANQCKTFKGYATFNPPVPAGNGPKVNSTITIHGTVAGCSPSNLTGGSGTVTGTIKGTKPGNCTTTIQGGGIQKGTSTTKWKNGKSSKFSATVKEGTGSSYNVATITGKVTSGLFAGKLVSGQTKFSPANSGACTTAPLKKVTFVQTKPLVLH
jgi:hypothetical protein